MITEVATHRHVVLFTVVKNITIILFHCRDPNRIKKISIWVIIDWLHVSERIIDKNILSPRIPFQRSYSSRKNSQSSSWKSTADPEPLRGHPHCLVLTGKIQGTEPKSNPSASRVHRCIRFFLRVFTVTHLEHAEGTEERARQSLTTPRSAATVLECALPVFSRTGVYK